MPARRLRLLAAIHFRYNRRGSVTRRLIPRSTHRNPSPNTSSSSVTAPATRAPKTSPTSWSSIAASARRTGRRRAWWCLAIPGSARWRHS